jgi:hypothetical protein
MLYSQYWQYLADNMLFNMFILTSSFRSLSLTFGRPCAIPEEYIRLDLPKALPTQMSASDEVHQMSTAFYNASM